MPLLLIIFGADFNFVVRGSWGEGKKDDSSVAHTQFETFLHIIIGQVSYYDMTISILAIAKLSFNFNFILVWC